ncbi:ribonuclease H-like domain-containing protein [Tanacetum coccineum]|uniref:Ribonuclease H-like domain-containing protein n=1 Tax=Tanacetum coccineum TaxID=301880 RepID=A0ABQ5E799_9ASTR
MASPDQQWYMDIGATSHLSSHTGNLQTSSLNRNFHSVIVGNESFIPVTHSGHLQIPNPYRPLHLKNVLVIPNIIKNLVSVRKFTTDNKCSIDFDPYGFTVRDYHTRQTLLRCDSTGDLYPLHVAASAFALLTNNHSLWHQRLGHPDDNARLSPEYWVEALLTAAYLLNILPSTSINNDIPYTKLFNKPTSYTYLRTFGCLCYPYTFPPHKLAPRTTPSIFLGTPIDTEKKLGPEGSPVTDPTLNHSLAGSLQYLTFTRPDLSYAVQQLCLYMHDHREPHLNAMKCVLCLSSGTLILDYNYFGPLHHSLFAYSDAGAGLVVRIRVDFFWILCFFGLQTSCRGSSKCQDNVVSFCVGLITRVANVVAEHLGLQPSLVSFHTPLFTTSLFGLL